ncbi:hypothetical protein GCM10009557_33730 [Virgisporangium ochraceum]
MTPWYAVMASPAATTPFAGTSSDAAAAYAAARMSPRRLTDVHPVPVPVLVPVSVLMPAP